MSTTERWLAENSSDYGDRQQRLISDVLAVLRAFASLRIKSDIFTYDDGRTQLLFCIHGLLPISFRNASYNIPLAIWITRDYPLSPPFAFVVPTSDMLIKPSAAVDLSGRSTIDYISLWQRKPEGCSILALVHALQEQFSRDPPVYAKQKTTNANTTVTNANANANAAYSAKPPPPLPSQSTPPTSRPGPPPLPPKPSSTLPPSSSDASHALPLPLSHTLVRPELPSYNHHPPVRNTVASPNTFPVYLPSHPSPQTPSSIAPQLSPPPIPPPPFTSSPPPLSHASPLQSTSIYHHRPPPPLPPPIVASPPPQISPPIATTAASLPVPAPNLLDQDDPEPSLAQPSPAPFRAGPAPPLPPNPELLNLHGNVHHRLTSQFDELFHTMARDSERLRADQADLLAGEPAIRDEMARLEAVRDVCRVVASKLRASVDQADKDLSELRRKGDPEVDELVCSTSIVHNQLINLVAEDNAIEDTIYHLHRALNAGRVDLERFLRTTRILAEEQFLKRALIERIQNGIPMGSFT